MHEWKSEVLKRGNGGGYEDAKSTGVIPEIGSENI